MKRLLKYMKQYRTEAIIGPLFKWLEALFELLVPLVVARLIDGAIPSGSESAVVRLCLVLSILPQRRRRDLRRTSAARCFRICRAFRIPSLIASAAQLWLHV